MKVQVTFELTDHDRQVIGRFDVLLGQQKPGYKAPRAECAAYLKNWAMLELLHNAQEYAEDTKGEPQ